MRNTIDRIPFKVQNALLVGRQTCEHFYGVGAYDALLGGTGFIDAHGRLTLDGAAVRAEIDRQKMEGLARQVGDRLKGRRMRAKERFPEVRGLLFWRKVQRTDTIGFVMFQTPEMAREYIHRVGGILEDERPSQRVNTPARI
jgi:hypothetical protein